MSRVDISLWKSPPKNRITIDLCAIVVCTSFSSEIEELPTLQYPVVSSSSGYSLKAFGNVLTINFRYVNLLEFYSDVSVDLNVMCAFLWDLFCYA